MSGLNMLSPSDCLEPPSHINHRNPDHFSSCFGMLNRLREDELLCDISLVVGNQTIKAHKIILASASPYFYAMFIGDMAEKHKDEIVLHNIDSYAVQLLIEYSYTGDVKITEDNVQVLLPASSLLQLISVREACCRFLMKQLHPSNCLGIRNFADIHLCAELQQRSYKYILMNFQEVMKTEEFFTLSFEELLSIISSDQLNVSKEESVYTAVMDWVKYNSSERSQCVPKLLEHIRFPLMQREFLMSNVEPENLVRDDADCKEYLLEAMKYHLMPEYRMSFISSRTKERNPDGMLPYIFAVGGGSLYAIHSECECYNPKLDRWFNISPMLSKRSRAGVTSLAKKLFVVGGYDGASDLSSCECYDPGNDKWTQITPMGIKRSCLGICGFEGLLYVCGGYDGASCLSSVERFDALNGIWTSCPEMSTRRRYCRVANIDGCLYALGGFDTSTYQASVERLDPRIGRWMSVPSMNQRRSSSGVATLNGMLYCVGGNDGTVCMSNGERFNVRRNTWEPIASMNARRSTHELVEINGKLVAIGGNDGNSSHNSVEMYDPESNRWTPLASMVSRRSSVGAAVVCCFNMEIKQSHKNGIIPLLTKNSRTNKSLDITKHELKSNKTSEKDYKM
ncbi:kelch-like protein 17 isoform X2 [Planococcus citri]